jgi:hypothetical protein
MRLDFRTATTSAPFFAVKKAVILFSIARERGAGSKWVKLERQRMRSMNSS